MPWIPRGLRNGIVTTHYPRRRDDYGPSFRSAVVVSTQRGPSEHLRVTVEACPTRAISLRGDQVQLDRGRCIVCGRCTELSPETFKFDDSLETSTSHRPSLVVPDLDDDDQTRESLRIELARRTRALRRSIHIRHVDAGSDGADEWEVAALTNPVYDVQRLGVFFTASPRHADVLLVTGIGSSAMRGPLRTTLDAMASPKVVIAAGVDAISGGLFVDGYASSGGIGAVVPVDVFIPGSPASPFGLLHGILLAVGLLSAHDRAGDRS